MGFFKDFKAFLLKGDIVNLATAVIVGGAFGKIVTSFTKDILMPPIGMLLGGVKFTELKIVLKDAVLNGEEVVTEAVTINYGMFIQTIMDFVIIGFCIFMVLKAYEKTKKKEEETPAAPAGPTTEELLAEIRDELKKQNTK
ncbi:MULTISPECIES: large-conductance mechanosensitive channel protein MscL [Galbibacter]|uniref:Large-conductance mechanosensitive channel n=1 Tax=Galbibacter orientalis DSM 19592 TaxID=926559 RepID=I3C3N5_9FLAO|nr:large-conductance mechanosensitive channel protein MscL [Galbibacter orientalis]EIJ38228.1 large conductance mechanosensitive channel protein [Galbibacter orientalis DSM 19592]|tara:strand:+ start:93 stop:515 length:423 start_codon:yes stop_codon:yes gene_type:complete